MPKSIILVFFALLLAIGCSDTKKNPVQQYGSDLTNAVKKAERAKVAADLVTIRAEIMRYKAENGEFPTNLQALNNKDVYPDLYIYDPATGSVVSK